MVRCFLCSSLRSANQLFCSSRKYPLFAKRSFSCPEIRNNLRLEIRLSIPFPPSNVILKHTCSITLHANHPPTCASDSACMLTLCTILMSAYAWLSGRSSVSGQRSFAVLCSTCSRWVTTYVSKTSTIGQPTRPTQPFILSGR